MNSQPLNNQKKPITAIIVEDEIRSQEALQKLLQEYCPQVNVKGVAATWVESVRMIDEVKPALIFLDIALPDGDGFNVLENIKHKNYRVIFVTAYDRYAMRAFDFSTLHYLLKPISHLQLQEAVSRYTEEPDSADLQYAKKLDTLKSNLNRHDQKIMLPAAEGYELIALDEIIRLEASHNYTHCFLTGGRDILVSRSLINFEAMLDGLEFARVHSKHLINLQYVKKYIRGGGGAVMMSDNSEISVSKARKNDFLDLLSAYARHL